MDKKKLIQYAVIFLLSYLVVNIFFNPNKDQAQQTSGAPFDIVTSKKQYGQDEIVAVTLSNNTTDPTYIHNDCPDEPLTVLKRDQGEWKPLTFQTEIACDTNSAALVIDPGKTLVISYQSWNHALFGEMGTYKISAEFSSIDPSNPPSVDVSPTAKVIESNEFEVTQRGFFSWLWTTVFYQPIYNALIYLVSVLPGHDLGWAVILLTLLIRTVLLIPSQRGLKSQRKMQELQPKLNHLKEKYKNNQQMLSQETMLLWKEHKVNPLGSCLPLLIQIPILIALYNVIQHGLDHNNSYLLYSGLQSFSLSEVTTNFLGILDLTKQNLFVLPLLVGGLQFLQLQLGIIRSKKQNQPKDEMQRAQQMMVYIMPVMITIFAASVPSGVALYYSISTLYGIAQQLIINNQKPDDKKDLKKNDDVEVRVISKHSKKS